MGINLKHDEYERLIRQLAGHRGSSITDAIGIAVRHELEREGVIPAPESFRDRVRRVQAIVAAAPILDPRPYREILYDEHGLPQ